MTSYSSRHVTLNQRPEGLPNDSTWRCESVTLPELQPGELLIQVTYLSIVPAMRGFLDDVPSYLPPVQVGAVMRASGTGRVVESAHPDFEVGAAVLGPFGVRDFAICGAADVAKIDLSIAKESAWLYEFGTTGMTAYFGLLEVGGLRPGQTVVVSGAAGAVGSLVGQIAKLHNCFVIGIAGGSEKCSWLVDELHFDAAIDYKASVVDEELSRLVPNGVDLFFDNVGGDVLSAGLRNLRQGARVVICGAISQYNLFGDSPHPIPYLSLLVNRASMTGFIVTDYSDRFIEAMPKMQRWISSGELIAREHVVDGGVDAFGKTFLMLFSGENSGKLILKV